MFCPRTQHNCPWPGLKPRLLYPKSSILITKPPCHHKPMILFNQYSDNYTNLTLALMISFPGGSGYNLKTLSHSCFNQGSTTASGLERKTLHGKRTDNVNYLNQINTTVNSTNLQMNAWRKGLQNG